MKGEVAEPKHYEDLHFEKILEIISPAFDQRGALSQRGGWAGILQKLSERHEIHKEVIPKIDFSLPGDPEYGDDPDNEFFNPSGKFKAKIIPQDLIDWVAKKKGTHIIFNIRKVEFEIAPEDGYDPFSSTEWLYLIIPDVKPACEINGVIDLHKTKGFPVAPDNHTTVVDKETIAGCLYDIDRKTINWFYPIARLDEIGR